MFARLDIFALRELCNLMKIYALQGLIAHRDQVIHFFALQEHFLFSPDSVHSHSASFVQVVSSVKTMVSLSQKVIAQEVIIAHLVQNHQQQSHALLGNSVLKELALL